MVSHCTAPQAQNKQSLQNWSRRHIGSLWQTQISLSSFTVVLKGNQSISFSAKLHISNSTVSIFESLQWETSKGDPWTTEPTPGFWPAACEWEISQGICTALLLISPLFSCSRGCPRGERLPVRPKGGRMVWGLTGGCHISAAWSAPLFRTSGCTCSTGSTRSSPRPRAQGWGFYWHTPQLGTTARQPR